LKRDLLILKQSSHFVNLLDNKSLQFLGGLLVFVGLASCLSSSLIFQMHSMVSVSMNQMAFAQQDLSQLNLTIAEKQQLLDGVSLGTL
jgi:hypothetical protein